MLKIRLHAPYQIFIAIQMRRRDCPVNRLAIVAVIQRGNIGRNQFPLALRERVGSDKEGLDKIVQRLGGLRAKSHRAANSRQTFRQSNVGHRILSFPPGDSRRKLSQNQSGQRQSSSN